jgi:type II secretion system protein D
MNLPRKLLFTGALALGMAVYIAFLLRSPMPVQAQNEAPSTRVRPPRQSAQPAVQAVPAPNNAAPPNATPPTGAPADAGANAPKPPSSSGGAQLPAELPAAANTTTAAPGNDEEMQLSFQSANVDTIVQWLAKNTGKSVVKHPKVQCQLTIVSSKKLKPREAVNLVYRALALEGFTTIESSRSILIVPDAQEPKMIPELIENTSTNIPDGRQRLIRIFQLEHTDPTEMKDKIKSVLSEKATVEVVERARQLMITDYTDNIRIASELIKELDVSSPSDVSVEFFKLKYADAEELGTLLSQIINAQAPAAKAGGAPQPGQPGMPQPGMPPGQPGMPQPGMPQPGGAPGASAASGQVKIWPDKSQNQLIVSAPKSKMTEVRKLLEVLDVEQTEDVTLRVLPLQNVSAEDLVKEIAPIYQKIGGKSGKERVEITANLRSNSLIILSSAENFKAIQKIVAALDREEAQEKIMKAFPLQNADAEDVAKQLDTLNEGSDSNSRNPYIFFYGGMGGGTSKKKPSFVADRRRNAVMVQAPPNQMEGIEKLIHSLDEPMNDKSLAPKIFRLKFISATDMEDVLNELFTKKQQQRSYFDYYNPFDRSNSSSDSGKLLGKVRITSEPYSNSIIVTSNSPEGLDAVEAVLKELDSPSQAGETTMRVMLKFARATTVASDLNILFAKAGSQPLRPQVQQAQPQDSRGNQRQNQQTQNSFGLESETKEDAYFPWLGGNAENSFGGGRGDGTGRSSAQRPVSDLIGRVRVVPDRRSNALLITSNLHFFPQVMKLIEDLDAPTPQVLIEAKIIEVSSDFRDKLGVRWSPDGKSFTGEDLENSVLVNTGATYNKVFAGSTMAQALKTGVLDASVNVNFLVQFLRKNTDARVLAEPQISIADNEAGKLFVGAQVPFISGSLNTDVGGRNDTFEYRDVGIILEVIPHINTADEVALKIRTEASSIRSGETLFGGAILDTRNFKTDLMVKHNETVVLGGIIQREQSDLMRKTPGLGSIPLLGWAFKKKDKTSREVELMVFLQPRITRSPEEARALLKSVEDKIPLIKYWDEDKPVGKPGKVEEEKKENTEPHS